MKKRSLGFLVLVLAFHLSIEAQNAPPTVQFSAANYSALEGTGVAHLTITKTGATTEAVTAYYKTRDGTAKAPSDYTFTGDDLTASVRFEPSETSKDIQIPIRNDGYKEPDETFEVYFTVIQGATSGSPGTATVTIHDDDPQGPLPPARTLNLATRGRVQTGDRITIGGFIITGSEEKPVLIRALGPSLAQAGVPANAVLLDPVIRLNKSDGSFADFNDNWREWLATERALEGTAFQPKDDREAAILDTLLPGAYTVWVVGKNQTQGIGLFEVYDFDANSGAELANLSTRGYVGTENDVMIGGFTLGAESGSVRIAIRGLGPSLAGAGLQDVLIDPALELHDSNGNVFASNDDWQNDSVSAAQLTAHGLALPDSKEAGLFVTLAPGTYTAILNGKSVGTGIGLVEVYNLK
ncbi:MAG: DVUA0089 family protein [Chthoniobacterales bacterium]